MGRALIACGRNEICVTDLLVGRETKGGVGVPIDDLNRSCHHDLRIIIGRWRHHV